MVELYPFKYMSKVGQHIDTARLSLSEFCGIARWRTPAPSSGRARRDIADALATVYWYQWIRWASPARTPYAVGRTVEPDAYWSSDDGERFHRNKWPKYARGWHRPHATLVERAERVFPGSARQIRHVLWEILKQPPSAAASVSRLERMLRPEVQSLIQGWRPKILSRKNGSVKQLAIRLERLSDLDGLAGMLLQLQAARIEGRSEMACQWASHAYRCLVLLGPQLAQYGIARPLFDLIELRFLHDVSHEGWRYRFPASRYLAAIEFAFDVTWHIKGVNGYALTRAQQIVHMQKVLNGRYGFECQMALNPFRHAVPGRAPLSADLWGAILRRIRLFIWAWHMRGERVAEALPTKAVFDGTDLHAWKPEPERPWRHTDDADDRLSSGATER